MIKVSLRVIAIGTMLLLIAGSALAQTKGAPPPKVKTTSSGSSRVSGLKELKKNERRARKEKEREEKAATRHYSSKERKSKNSTKETRTSSSRDSGPKFVGTPRESTGPVEMSGHKKQVDGHDVTVIDVDTLKK